MADDYNRDERGVSAGGNGFHSAGDLSGKGEPRIPAAEESGTKRSAAGEEPPRRTFRFGSEEPAEAAHSGSGSNSRKFGPAAEEPAPVEDRRSFRFDSGDAPAPESGGRNSYKFAPAAEAGGGRGGTTRRAAAPPKGPGGPKWPWLAAAGAVLLLIVGIVAASRLSHPRTTSATVDSSMSELAVLADSFRDPSGKVPEGRAQEAIDAVYASARNMPGVTACSKDEYGVFIEVREGLDYVYTPEIAGRDQGSGTLDIVTLQPYDAENRWMDPSLDHDGLDTCAAETAARDSRWSFAGRDNVNDASVTLDRILALDDYKMILWHGHGGYQSTMGYYLCTTIPVTKALLRDYPCLTKETAVIELGGNLGLKPQFFEKNFADGAFDNAFIYLATCYSGKSTALADILVKKGAAVVFVNSESIYRSYNLNMLHMIVESFCVGPDGPMAAWAMNAQGESYSGPDSWTIADSLWLAKQVYGNWDPGATWNAAEVYYVGRDDVDRLTYTAWMDRFGGTGPASAAYPQPDELFDYTCWDVLFGCTIGTQYVGQFRPDATFTLVNWNRDVIEGTFTYDGGLLTLFADAFHGSISYEYIVGREDIYLPDVGTTLGGSGGDGFYSLQTHSSMGTSEEFTYYMHEKGDSTVYNEWMARAQERETPPEDSLAGTYTSEETTIRLILTENSDGSYHVRFEETTVDDWYLDYDAFADHGQFVIDLGNSVGDTIWIARYGGGLYVEVPEFVEARTNRRITGYYYVGAVSAPGVSDLTGMDINIRLYRNRLTEAPGGILADVDLVGIIEFDDAYVDALAPGDVIPLSQYGYDDVYVESIGRFDWGIELGGGYSLMRLNDPDRWMLEDSRDDYWGLQYVTGSAVILIPPRASIVDELIPVGYGASPQELDNIMEFYERADSYGYSAEREPAVVSVDHGVAISVFIPYHP